MGIWARSQREAQARHVLLASGRRNGEGGGGVGSKTRNVNYWRSWKALEILSWELKIYISGLSFVLTHTSTLHYER